MCLKVEKNEIWAERADQKKKKYKTLWERLFDVDVLGVFEVFYVKGRASSAQQ